jgi:4-hydroxy-tetrahydrodipicolinate synthase
VALREQLEDVNAVTVTPFGGHDVDRDGVRRNARFLADAGIRLIVCGGNTGEFYALSPEELRAVVEETVAAVPRDVVVLAATGYRAELAAELAHAGLEAGARGVMIHWPVQPGAGEDGLARYYASVIGAIQAPTVLYVRGSLLTERVLETARAAGELVGVKYAVPDLGAFARLAAAAPDLAWICGLAEGWAPFFWQAGARGFTSGLACVAPARSLDLLHALREGAAGTVLRLWHELLPFEQLRDRHARANDVAVVKAALDRIGLAGGAVRPPLSALSDEDRAELDAILASWGVA